MGGSPLRARIFSIPYFFNSLTCVYADKDTVEKQVRELKKYGIENILALRGDPPIEDIYIPPKNGFLYAKDLVSFVKEIACDFCVGVAGFPEGHCSISDLSVDTNYLKEKIESGAEYVITQMFFDNRYFFDFKERCEKKEISVPIIPGIMPITNVGQIKKMTQICGATIPKELLNKIEKHSSRPSFFCYEPVWPCLQSSFSFITFYFF